MPVMGFERAFARAILAVAMLCGGTAAAAAGSSQPGWTPLSDPDAGFVRFRSAEEQASPDQLRLDRYIADFSLQVARAIAAQQQENDQACSAIAAARGATARSADWQASCRYRRY